MGKMNNLSMPLSDSVKSSRSDAFTFYSMTVISYLESAVPNYVENLDVIFKDNPELVDWLDNVWLHEESEHGELAKGFVQQTWPEYDWQKGYEKFLVKYGPRCAHEELRDSPGLEALARCVTETQATMSYRCLMNYSSDPKLIALMKKMSTDEVRHYREFRKTFDQYNQIEKNSFFTKARTIIGRSELVKDEDLFMAFEPIADCWKGQSLVPHWEYSDYMDALGKISREYMPIEEAQKMLFKPMRTKGKLNNFLVNCIAGIVKRQFLAVSA
ncbi:MAG: rubrerythrin [Cryomorphaceae bacterium]|jgi:rubrerythrin